jgi:vancomycin aglycone glucosyltransferase
VCATELHGLGAGARVHRDFGWDRDAVAAGGSSGAAAPPIPDLVTDLITDQFETIRLAAAGCDVILGANAHQYAARSIAELYGVPYVNALYAPTALPTADNTRVWNERSLERVNANRVRLGLTPIDDVLRHIIGEQPWLAADPMLAPLPVSPGISIVQTGAWLLTDSTPLGPELERFLEAGSAPVYFGFGSMPAGPGTSRSLIDAARQVGQRAVVSRGWAELELVDQGSDSIAIGDVNQQLLFPRVAVVVHHGGAGTTIAAARAAVPQVVVPMFSDQPFWASRVRELGIGASVPFAELSVERLAAALDAAKNVVVAERAAAIAGQIVVDGAKVAARRLVGRERMKTQ